MRAPHPLACASLPCLSLALAVPASALTPFLTEDVDTGEFLGTHTSVAVDADGRPHISYKDEITIRLKYAVKNGETWTIEVVDDPAEDVGSYSSIALDSAGNPHVAYYDATLDRPKLASRVGGVWTNEVIEDPAQDVGKFVSLAIDANDRPHVAYYDDTLNRLKYAVKLVGTWFVQVAHDPVENVGQHASLALDNTGRPHIAYVDITTPRVLYAALFGSSWTVLPVDQDANVPAAVSLALDASGTAHIAYRIQSFVQYAQNYDYPLWISENVTPGNGAVSIEVDPAGNPRIASYVELPGAASVTYAVRTAPDEWDVEYVDRAGFVGDYTSLALDRQGNPRISYYDGGSGHLRYADASLYVREPFGGDTWPVGAERTIRWDGIGPVTLSLSVDGGRSYEPLESGIIDGRVTVRVPHAPTRFARVRVARNTPFATAESDSLFTIDASVILAFLRAAPGAAGGIDLAWSTVPGPEDLAAYRVERAAGPGDWILLAETSHTTLHDPDGTAGRAYRLWAVNGLGTATLLGETRSMPARPLTATPVPFGGGRLVITFGTAGGLGGAKAPARLAIYDVAGRLVRVVHEGTHGAGFQRVSWDGRDAAGREAPAGTYLLELVSGRERAVLKVPVVRGRR